MSIKVISMLKTKCPKNTKQQRRVTNFLGCYDGGTKDYVTVT